MLVVQLEAKCSYPTKEETTLKNQWDLKKKQPYVSDTTK